MVPIFLCKVKGDPAAQSEELAGGVMKTGPGCSVQWGRKLPRATQSA